MKTAEVRIAVDCMGGDFGLSVTVPAAIAFIKKYSNVSVLLVGLPSLIESELDEAFLSDKKRISIIPAAEVIEMSDSVEMALRKKKDSSMHVAARLVQIGHADACVSAGNTGAWMAISRYILKTLDGIDRPAIATSIPNRTGYSTTFLDLGANADCSADHLFQFAVMGAALSQVVDHRENPSIGLLNIGEEVIKGNETVKAAADLLRSSFLNFYGNVEGNDIFKGTVDVVVCNGFVGNIALKAIEGLAKMLSESLQEEFERNFFSKLSSVFALPILKRYKHRMDNRRYNGAVLLGLRGVVIKSHGSADKYAFGFALQRAREIVVNQLLEHTNQIISKINQRTKVEKITKNLAV